MKNILKFLLLLVVVAGISFGISLIIAKRRDGTLKNVADNSILNKFNDVQEYQYNRKGSTKLTSEEASFFHFSQKNQEIRYYHSRTGNIKSVSIGATTKETKIATIKPRATAITWSPDGTEIIATYGTELIYTNLTSGASSKLDKNIFRPVFGNVSAMVAYLYYDNKLGVGNISIADSQIKSFKTLLKTRLDNWEIQWTNEKKLSLLATPVNARLKSLYVMNTEKEGLEVLLTAKPELEINWSPDGKKLLYSKRTEKGYELFTLNMATREEQRLNVLSIASKCAWSSDNKLLYCAIPETQATSSINNQSEDSFIRINETGDQEKLFSAADAGFVDARNLVYSSASNILIFKNFKDGRLYYLGLSK